MRTSQLKAWNWLHKWSSLVCTVFLLMLCITGLPLIFHDEIDNALNSQQWTPKYPQAEHLSLDALLQIGLQNRDGEQAIYMSFDTDRPVVNITTGPLASSPSSDMHFASFDATSGDLVTMSSSAEPVMDFILQLHTDMFLGLGGMLILAFMGTLFIIATLSGVVLYYQFMRRLDFGTIRTHKKRRLQWLDYHNFFGVITLAWVLVVGITGVINALESPILDTWRDNNINTLIAQHQTDRIASPSASLQKAVESAIQAAPNMTLQFVAFPGSEFSTSQHYAIFLHGNTPLTKELSTPVLVDAVTGEFIGLSEMPWYMKTLSLSRPLHFGDYGGLLLKVVWALLTALTIFILITGVYLWYKKYSLVQTTR